MPPPRAEPPARVASPHDGQYQDSDRATARQREEAISKLKAQGFKEVYLPQGGAYYGQNDKERWAKYPYPGKGEEPSESTRKLGPSGCAPTSLAIAHATLWDTPTTPPEVADFALKHEYSSNTAKGGGSNMRMIEHWARENNMDVETTRDLDKLREGLKDGGVAVVHVKGGIFNYPKGHPEITPKGGHVIAVTGYAVDENGQEWFFVANPGKDASAQTLEGRGVVVDKDLHHAAGRVRVTREALEDHLKGKGAYVLSKHEGKE